MIISYILICVFRYISQVIGGRTQRWRIAGRHGDVIAAILAGRFSGRDVVVEFRVNPIAMRGVKSPILGTVAVAATAVYWPRITDLQRASKRLSEKNQ
ncbi:MAG: hypothetical protein P8J79_01200 [Halioglobus sp.]|nr:hypothetical protein [Halioglobus sp.]